MEAHRERDVVCGMMVDPANAAGSSEYEGKTYYFCGKGCKARFDTDPARYVRPEPGAQDPESAVVVARGTHSPDFPQASTGSRIPDPGSRPSTGSGRPELLEGRIPTGATKWTCPMHPEIIRDGPGSCPICGMALEPLTITAEEPENDELRDMTRRFWIGVLLTIPTLAIGMADLIPGRPLERVLSPATATWGPLGVAPPVVLWGGWPFFVRGWESVVNRSLNMFTLIGLGVGVAYVFSVVATLAPGLFPPSFRNE